MWMKPLDQLEASVHGELLNHMSCLTVWFTWNEKLPIRSRPRCLTSGMIGAVGTVPYGAMSRSTLSMSSSLV